MSAQIRISRANAQGDPGLFGFLGKVAKGVGGAIGGALSGNPMNIVSGALGGFAGGAAGSRPPRLTALEQRTLGAIRSGQTANIHQGAMQSLQRKLPGGINLPGLGPPGMGFPTLGGGRLTMGEQIQNGAPPGFKLACPSGFHPNKSDYFTKSEGFIPEGTKCVKNRRRNPANPRALDRALSRLNMAKRLQNKLAGYATDKYTRTGKRRD